ncbi:alpha/beta fold hydrolase [Occultella aeris]|uniref:Non-heme bromoperoxidase BpoC n=1 Tax=Occultella aeris TaxID=2761496 RepID=A0A7M4DF87_9MICO|nr:alpha/beta hydrolase [Occultella aeris]VZO35580.1 Putative non-heme bromoperoxidase BpoC [Occultella aeris]
MTKSSEGAGPAPRKFVDAPTRPLTIDGSQLVVRNLGVGHDAQLPLVALTHLGANLDSWDPELVDPLAAGRRVILLGYRGVGASSGGVRDRFADMAMDAIAAIRGLGLSRVDVFGLSMGGMVVQEILRLAPEVVDRVILAGTGPQGGPGLTRMTGVFLRGVARGAVTFTNPTSLLFFTRTPQGTQAASDYQARLRRRRADRDRAVSPAVLPAQLRAVNRWGHELPAPLMEHIGPVLILHGDSDRMVPPGNVDALRKAFPDAQTQIFPDSGHGVVSQNRQAITDIIDRFLRR